MSLGARLRSLRTARGLTQKELAAPRYTHAYVSTIEAGRRVPSRSALEHFATKLRVEPEELLTGRPPNLPATLRLRLEDARISISAGDVDGAAEALAKISREAKRYDLTELWGKAEAGLALCAERRGDPEGAIELYERAEGILAGAPAHVLTDAVVGKARCLEMQGDYRYAIHLLESFLGRLRREGLEDPGSLVRIHASLILSYFEVGLFAKADESASEALRLAPGVDDPARLAVMHTNVARVLLHKGKPGEAEDSLKKAEDLYRQAELETEIGHAHLARGIVASRQGSLEAARDHLGLATAIFKRTRSSIDEARASNELGRVERLEGRAEEARTLLQHSIDLLRRTPDDPILAWAHRELGLCDLDDDPPRAEKNLRVAIDLYDRVGEAVELASTYRILGDLLERQGDSTGGCSAYREGILVLEERL